MDSKKKARWPPSRYCTLCFDVATRTSIPASSISRSSNAVSNGAVSWRLVTSSMIVLREFNGARRHPIKSAPGDEPVGIAHVQGARAAAAPATLAANRNRRLRWRGRFLDMRNLRRPSRPLCAAMQYEILFIFQKGSRAAIEERVEGLKPLPATQRSALFRWKPVE